MTLEDDDSGPIGDRLKVTYWAVRVAQELARCQTRWSVKGSTPSELQTALAKLELALYGASQHAVLNVGQ